jgi:cysteine desulfurase
MIYLDYAADTPVCEPVLSAFLSAAREYGANPNSGHAMGLWAKRRLDEATEHIAGMLGAQPEEIIMTSGATEANNLAILGAAHAYQSRGRHLITSPMEHASVTGPMTALKSEGFELDFMKVKPDGQVDTAHLKSLLRPDTILVSLCSVDSEAGVIQPLDAVREVLAGFPNCRLHVDATQAVGKLPVRLDCADLVTLSPHKFYGITGSGALIARGGIRLTPLWHGGSGATPYRSGTPALALAVAMEAALEEALKHLDARLEIVCGLNGKLRQALGNLPFVTLNSPESASPYILNFSVANIRARELIALLSERGICVSSKSACCAPAAPSHPVMAMTNDRRRSLNTVRVSLSHLTTQDEIGTFLHELQKCAAGLEDSHGKQPED